MNQKAHLIGAVSLGLMATTIFAAAQLRLTTSAPPRIGTLDPNKLVIPPVGTPGGPQHELGPVESEIFASGLLLFDKAFHRTDGVGTPEMNSDSCRGCHQDPAIGGSGGLELNVSRFANDNGGAGPFMNLPGGQGLSKLRPPYTAGREEYDPLTADVFEQRQTPSIFGLGLVDTISDATIIANEDPLDMDGDGIFGIAHIIDVAGVPEVGKFGWKAQLPKLSDFVNDAAAGEIGLTTPDNGRGFNLLTDADTVPDPELDQTQVDDIAFFLANLAAPTRDGSTDPQVAVGEMLFDTIGCAKCHIPTLMGTGGPVDLFSDVLLHDVMPVDFRGMEEPGAPAGFFRTPFLWGIEDTAPYMHDGRGEDLRGAILAHFSEGESARLAFEALTASDQAAVILFLEDL